MATEVTYNGDGSDVTFNITFPFLESSDVKVQVNGTTVNTPADYSISGNVVTFETAPSSGTNNVRLYRNTAKDSPAITYSAGSALKADDLNKNHLQSLYCLQEIGTVTSNDEGLGLTAGSKGDIHVSSGTDWYIRTDAVDSNMLNTNSVTSDAIAANAVGASELADDAVDTNAIANNAVTTAKIGNSQITQAKIASTVIFTPVATVIWYAGSTAPTGYLKSNGDTIPNGTGTVQGVTADFSALYAIIGATLPDLRGEFIRGFDDGKGTDSGRSIASSQSGQNASHDHSISVSGTTNTKSLTGSVSRISETFAGSGQATGVFSKGGNNTASLTPGGPDSSATGSFNFDASHDHTFSVSGTSGSQGGEARPRNIALLACIKY